MAEHPAIYPITLYPCSGDRLGLLRVPLSLQPSEEHLQTNTNLWWPPPQPEQEHQTYQNIGSVPEG